MKPRKADGPFVVERPSVGADSPAWIKVSVLAALGFAVGIAWPRFTGLKVGPNAPGDALRAAALAASSNREPVGAAVGVGAQPPPAAGASAAPAASSAAPRSGASDDPPVIAASKGILLSCRTVAGDTLKGAAACGEAPPFDPIAWPRLRQLGKCSVVPGVDTKLTVVFNLDFPSNRVAFEVGRSSTVDNPDAIAACLRPLFQAVSLGPVRHNYPRYTMAYNLRTVARTETAVATRDTNTESAKTDEPEIVLESNAAQVMWEAAVVRDSPRTGRVLARLQRGTPVQVGNSQEGWFHVKYGTGEGWVYRGSIGK